VRPLRVAVAGVGHMGLRHAEKVKALEGAGRGVSLAGVADVDALRSAEVAGRLGTRGVSDPAALYAEVDALVVAVPTIHHHAVAMGALAAGVDVLVEKPIAATLEQAEDLVAAARSTGRILQVGHQEWFNAAMRSVRESVEEPRFAEIHRMGPFPDRSDDVDVVLDLMIHDIEILQGLLGAEPDRVEAVGVPVLTDLVDIANARLSFGSRCVANLTASRVSVQPMRRFRLFQRDAYVTLDFLEQRSAVFRRRNGTAGEKPEIEVHEFKGERADTLLAQLEVFLEAVRRQGAAPELGRGVTAEAATSALRTAHRVIGAMPPPGDSP